ncbi:MAG: 3-hydroxyacyl-CoA dehydrogenase NAD-binding domain-containing protein [Chitinophagales bacterium]
MTKIMFKIDIDNDKIATVLIDMPGRSANVLNEEFDKSFLATIEALEAKKGELTGVIFTSPKSTFIAGADLDKVHAMTDAKAVFDMCETLKSGLRRVETLGIPVVAAINGSALGGGYEVALACHHRVALNNPRSVIGLPEVGLGLLPGGGGIVRLTRMLGLQNALPFLTEGKKLKPKAAVAAGLADELAETPEEMMEKAKAWIKANPKAQAPWDVKGFRFPGGAPTNPKVAMMLPIVPAMSRAKTHGNYPAVQAIISTAVEGALVDFDTASRIESRYFTSLTVGKVSKNMTKAFWFDLNAVKKGASRPEGFERGTVKKVGVLGAGMMGAGIAYSCASKGIPVVLKDVTKEKADFGKSYSEKITDKLIQRGRLTKEKQEQLLSLIHPTDSAADLKGCDLIIEAVFEDRGLKAKVTEEAEAQIDDNAIYASNTSTLPITGLAKASKRPNNFIGLHYFSPVDKMPLVEIIVGEQTSDETLARAFDFVLQTGKTPIVVNDSRGFYTSRVFSTYVQEGIAMLGEGVHPKVIENAGIQAGMPVGPLALTDEVSLSLMEHIKKQTEKDLAEQGLPIPHHPANKVADKMLSLDRKGKAAGAGFYEYPEKGQKYLWPELNEIFNVKVSSAEEMEELKERMMIIQSLETIRCLEEGVLRNVADANIGSIFGWGFAPFKGGTLQYANDFGLKELVTRSEELAKKYGDRFNPPTLLRERAKSNQLFI